MKKPLYIVGHKNPDSDSVCSAIAYAKLKEAEGTKAKALVNNGEINNETKYLLDRFNFSVPETITTAKCNLKEIEIDKALIMKKDVTIRKALNRILNSKSRTIFITDNQDKLEAVISLGNLTSVLIAEEKNLVELMKGVRFTDIVETLEATVITEAKNFRTNGKIYFIPNLYNDLFIEQNAIVVVGNSFDVQRHMINSKVGLLIICGENWVDHNTIELAKKKGVSIIYTKLSLLKVSQYIYQSPAIEHVMDRNVISFNENISVDVASKLLRKTRHRTYPVVDNENHIVGAISRYHLLNYEKKRFVLVDHNEKSQTVNDISSGDVVEIVDHHRLGDIQTSYPIDVTCKIVGSTCSIVANRFFTRNISLDKNTAGLLLGGILSDTMNLKSPTTTDFDLRVCDKLLKIAEVSRDELFDGMIAESKSLMNKTNEDLLYEDFKVFNINAKKISISQLICFDQEEYLSVKERLEKFMKTVSKAQNFDAMIVLFTSPYGEGSYILTVGKLKSFIDEAFEGMVIDDFAANVLSRKKQVLPIIVEYFNK